MQCRYHQTSSMDLIIQSLDRPSLQECRSCRLCNRNLQIPPEPYLCSYTSTALRLRDQASHTHTYTQTHTHIHTNTHVYTHTHTQEVVAIFPTLSHTAEVSCLASVLYSRTTGSSRQLESLEDRHIYIYILCILSVNTELYGESSLFHTAANAIL